jgi:hypothetical protein
MSIYYSFKARKSKIKWLAHLVPCKDLLLSLQMAFLLLGSHMVEKELWSFSCLIQLLVMSWGPSLMTVSKSNYLPKP